MKQYIPMSEDEAWAFIEGHYVMSVATAAEGGRPHNTPMWYTVRDHKVYFRAQHYKKKIGNVRRRPWVSCVVEDGDKYTELRGVVIEGRARVAEEPDLVRLVNEALGEKYRRLRDLHRMPEDWRRQFEGEKRVVVEVTPEKIVSWDNRKWLKRG